MVHEVALSQLHMLMIQRDKDHEFIAEQNGQLKYLGKQFVSFLILKNWAKIRRIAYDEEVKENKRKIAQQMAYLEEN